MAPYLIWKSSSGREQRLDIRDDEVTLGRLSESDIVLANPYISRRHAKIVRRDGSWVLVDLGSTHGTFVNGRRVSEQKLRHGDRISLGRDQVELRFYSEENRRAPHMSARIDSDDELSVMQLTSVMPIHDADSSHLEKISHLLDVQYQWEKNFSADKTFEQILDAALKLSGAERGFILIKQDPGFKYVVGMNGHGERLSESEFRTSHSIVQEVLNEGHPVLMTENIDQAFAQRF